VPTTSPARAPRRDATENREAILAAAKTVLNRDPKAPLEAIAIEAGLTRTSPIATTCFANS
jgi:AcrR family transcriptional regulator